MNSIPKCFDLIKDIDAESILPLAVQFFKGNMDMHYQDIKALQAVIGLNHWKDVDFNVTEDYFCSLPAEPICCSDITSKYKDNGIDNCCMVCELSNSYKNTNIKEEEAIISYIINNHDMRRRMKDKSISMTTFRSVVLFRNGHSLISMPLLSMIYEKLQSQPISEISNSEELTNFLAEAVSVEIDDNKLTRDYCNNLKEMNISIERVVSSLKTVLGEALAEDILIDANTMADTSVIGILSLEHSEPEEKYFPHSISDREEQQLSCFPEPQQPARTVKRQTGSSLMKPDTIRRKPNASKETKIAANALPRQMTIDEYSQHKSEVGVKQSKDTVVPSDTKDIISPVECEAAPVDTEYLSEAGPMLEPIGIETLMDFNTIQSKLLTSKTLYVHCFAGSMKILTVFCRNNTDTAYVLNLSDPGIYREVLLLLISPSIIKVMKNLIPLGRLYKNDTSRFKAIFEIKTAEALIKDNYQFATMHRRHLDTALSEPYDTTKLGSYSANIASLKAQYDDISLKIENMGMKGKLEEKTLLTQVLAMSGDLIEKKEAPRNLVTGKLVSDKPLELDPVHAGTNLPANSEGGVEALIIEKSLIEIFGSKLTNMTDIKLYCVNNRFITIDVCDKYLAAAFDVVNQYMISTFRNYVDKKFSPTIMMSLSSE